MSGERRRTDLYYFMKADCPVAVHGDGRVGSLQEEYVPVELDGKRMVTRQLVQTALFDSLPEYVVFCKQKREEERSKYEFRVERAGWIEYVTPEVLAEFEQWRSFLHIPTQEEVRSYATSMPHADEEKLQTQLIAPYGESPEVYYKYPLRRHYKDGQAIDEPFDIVALLIEHPEALTFEVKTQFDRRGRMAAELVGTFDAGFVDSQNGEAIDEVDALNERVAVVFDYWVQAPGQVWRCSGIDRAVDLGSAMVKVQRHLAIRRAAERPRRGDGDTYEKLMERLRRVGGGALTLVREEVGASDFGDYWTRLSLNKNPYDPSHAMRFAEGYYITDAIKAAIEKLDEEKMQKAIAKFLQKE